MRDLHRRDRQPGPGARVKRQRARGDRTRGQHDPRRDGRDGRARERGAGRRDQPADLGRPRAAPSGPARRAGLCRHPRRGGPRAYSGHSHQEDAARQGRRPRRDRPRDRALHRGRPRRRGPPRWFGRDPQARRRCEHRRCGRLRRSAQGFPRDGNTRDGGRIRQDQRRTEAAGQRAQPDPDRLPRTRNGRFDPRQEAQLRGGAAPSAPRPSLLRSRSRLPAGRRA